jgi:hypothetical protein
MVARLVLLSGIPRAKEEEEERGHRDGESEGKEREEGMAFLPEVRKTRARPQVPK